MDWVSETDSTHYFHNLKWDGKFILPWLFDHGFQWTDQQDLTRRNTFKTMIDKMGAWYTITILWDNGNQTEIRDSVKKLPMTIKAMAKSFDLEVTKGEIDYDKHRPIGYQPDENERSYQYNDCRILALALRLLFEEGATKLTVGADSLAHFKEIYGGKRFSSTFPVLESDLDAELRQSFRGGWTYAASRFRRKLVGRGRTYDVNSLYPAVMYNSFLPVGYPTEMEALPDRLDPNKLYIFQVTITAKLKPKHVPCIQLKGYSRFVGTEYVEEITEPVDVWVTSVDWELWNEQYDIEYSFVKGYEFRGAKGIFVKFIDHWMDIKKNSKGGKRALAKLHLNSLYGKFGTHPLKQSQVPVMGEDGIVRYVEGEEKMEDAVYVPMASFITAYARAITIRAAQRNYDDFLYADTDSLHLLGEGDPDDLWVDPQELGAWKHEYDFVSAVFSRAKCYTEHKAPHSVKHTEDCEPGCTSCEWETHIAGLPAPVAAVVRFKHHLAGYLFGGPDSPAQEPRKKMPKTVRGGVILITSSFKLNI